MSPSLPQAVNVDWLDLIPVLDRQPQPLWVHEWSGPVQKTLIHSCLSQPLLSHSLGSIFCNALWALGAGVGDIDAPCVAEYSAGTDSLHFGRLRVSALVTFYGTKKLLWRGLRAALIYAHRSVNLEGSLTLSFWIMVVIGSPLRPASSPVVSCRPELQFQVRVSSSGEALNPVRKCLATTCVVLLLHTGAHLLVVPRVPSRALSSTAPSGSMKASHQGGTSWLVTKLISLCPVAKVHGVSSNFFGVLYVYV